jgi:hypothetical protein
MMLSFRIAGIRRTYPTDASPTPLAIANWVFAGVRLAGTRVLLGGHSRRRRCVTPPGVAVCPRRSDRDYLRLRHA